MAAMAAASQALSLSTSFVSPAVQDSQKKLDSLLSSLSSLALRCNALRTGVAVGRRTAVASPVVRAAMAEAAELESPEMEERHALEAWVKQQLLGGFSAARLIGTGRRKTAKARVVLVEGTGKIVINDRSAQDYLHGHQDCHAMVPLEGALELQLAVPSAVVLYVLRITAFLIAPL